MQVKDWVKKTVSEFGSHLSPRRTGDASPVRLFFITSAGIFVAEILAMAVVYDLAFLPYYQITLIDAAIMIILVFPFLYFFSVRPLGQYIEMYRQAVQTLQQKDELQQRFFNSIDIMIAYMDRDFNFIKVNDAYARSSGGVTAEYFGGKNHFALYPHPENQAIFQQVVNSGEPYSVYEKPFEYPDQPERGVTYWNWSLQPVKGSNGIVEGLVLSLIDVTERKWAQDELHRAYEELELRVKQRTEDLRLANRELQDEIAEREQAEIKLRSSEERYRGLFNSMTEGFALHEIVCDPAGEPMDYRFIELNPSFERITGLDRKSTVGKTVKQVLPDIEPTWIERYGNVALTRQPIHFVDYTAATKRWYEIYCYSPATNQFATLFFDITERKKTEEQLHYQAALLSNVNDAIIASDSQYRLTSWNSAAEALYGWKAEEVLGCNGLDIIHTEWPEHSADEMRRTITETGRWRGEATQKRKDGTRFPVEVSSIVLYDMQGDVTGYVSVNRDITERRHSEQALHQSQLDLSRAQEVGQIGSWRLDVRRDELTWSDENHRLFGIPVGTAMTYETFLSTIHPDDRDYVDMRWSAALRGEPYDIEHRIVVNGSTKWVREKAYLEFDSENNLLGGFGITQDITERKQTQEQLQKSNQKLTEILASIQDDFYVLDRNWDFVYVNPLFTKKIGKEPEDFVGNNIWEMFPKHTGTILEENFRAAMETREVRRFEVGGKYTNAWYRMTAFPSAEGVTVIGTDITEIKQTEGALRESEEKFRRAFADANIGFAMTNAQGRFLEVNPAYCQLTGYHSDELLTMEFRVLIHPEDRDENLMRIEQMLRGEISDFLIENRYVRKDNQIVWVRKSISLVRSADGKPQWIIALTEDITERKQAEYALRLSQENFSKAFQSSPAALLITRLADGKFMELNDAYSRIVGYDRAELWGHCTTEFNIFINESDRKEIVNRLLANGSIRNFETSIRHQSGAIRYVVAAQELITFDDEACILTSLEDITELKKAEMILQRTNRTLRAHSASNQAMLHATNEADLLNDVCKIVVEDCGHAMVWVGFAEQDEKKSVRPVAHSGFEEGYLETLMITWADTERGRGPTGTAIRTGKSQICRNMLTDPLFAPWREQALKRGYASSIVLPLVTKSGVLGAITIYSREPDAFAPDEADLLNELALDLSHGIEMIRLREAHELTAAALRESEARFRLALSHAPVTVAVQDRDLHYTWAYNQRTRSRDEIIGKTDADLFPEEAERLTALKLHVLETGENASEQLWVNSNNGRLFLDLFMEPLKNEKGDIMGVGLATVDLTALKLAEEELRLAHDELELRVRERTAELAAANLELSREIAERLEVERQLRIQTAAMEAAANGIIITDPQGTMLWSNPAMTQISGYERAELVGHSTRLFNSGRNEIDFYNDLWTTILAGNVWRGEITNRRKDGSLYIEEQTITPVRNDAEQLSHFIAIKQDVTERKLIYAQLEASNQELMTLTNSERQQRFLAEGLVESSVVLNMSLELRAVLDRIFEQTRRIIPYLGADIVLIEEGVATLVQQWWTDEHSDASIVSGNESLKICEFPIWEKITITKAAVMVPDTRLEEQWNTYFGMKWIQSYLGAPLIYNDQIIGIINLISDQANAFHEDMVKALRAFAAPAAVAIQNARLYENEQQNRKVAEILSAASVALAQTLDTQMVMETILDYVQSIMRFDAAYVVLNEGDERFRIRAARSIDHQPSLQDSLMDQTIDMLSEPTLRSYFTKHESTYIPDSRERSVWNPPVQLASLNCWLAIPLESMGKILGIVVIAHTTPDAFARNQIQLVEAVVKQAVVALQNAWLFEQVRSGRERLQQLSRHLVEVQENERKYIARELHDETSQSLTSLKMGLQVIEKEADRRVRLTEQVRNLQALADETLESLHHLAVNLRPASLDHLGLVDALTSLVESTKQRSSLQAHFKIIGLMPVVTLTEEIETSVYRIVQESITNVVRHAHATYVDVILEWQEEKILILIEDDGVGMDMKNARETGRLGLIGMQERAEMLGGRLLVDSTPQIGTTLVVEIPYANSNPYRR